MGTATGKTFTTLRATGRGSDHYGNCEVCNTRMSEAFAFQTKREYQRTNGELYGAPITGGTYGHRDCLIGKFGQPGGAA